MISQACGWAGAAALLAAYILVSSGRLAGQSARYNLINLAGGALLAYASWVKGAWPSVTLNLVWIVIGLRAIGGSFRKTRATSAASTPSS
jgi:hypothetical protein